MTTVPLESLLSDRLTTLGWLGGFWRRLFRSPGLPIGLREGGAMLLASSYLDFLEASGVLDRDAIPVMRREMWAPLVLRRSAEGKAEANRLRIGMSPAVYIGPQPSGSPYGDGRVFTIGGSARLPGESYSCDARSALCIVDSIVSPSVVLTAGNGFEISDGAIRFAPGALPFDLFPVRRTSTDEEVVLWMSDALYDSTAVENHYGRLFGLSGVNSDVCKRMVNGLWDVLSGGSQVERVSAAVCALVDTPVSGGETVEAVSASAIVTDAASHHAPGHDAVPGMFIDKGDSILSAFKVYSTDLQRTDPMFQVDVPGLFLPPSMLAASGISHGIGFGWAESTLRDEGGGRLRFDVSGFEPDIRAFWAHFDASLARAGKTHHEYFARWLSGVSRPGGIVGSLQPVRAALDWLSGSVAFVVFDSDRLAPGDRFTRLGLLAGMLPLHSIVLFSARVRAGDSIDVSETVHQAGSMLAATASDRVAPGYWSTRTLSYDAQSVSVRWVPSCRG